MLLSVLPAILTLFLDVVLGASLPIIQVERLRVTFDSGVMAAVRDFLVM